MILSNLVATHNDMGTFLMKAVYGIRIMHTTVVGARYENLQYKTWIQCRSQALHPRSRRWKGNKIIHKHRILHGQNAGMFSDEFCLWDCKCYGQLSSSKNPRGIHTSVTVPSANPFHVHLQCTLFNIYVMNQCCLTKFQKGDCVSCLVLFKQPISQNQCILGLFK